MSRWQGRRSSWALPFSAGTVAIVAACVLVAPATSASADGAPAAQAAEAAAHSAASRSPARRRAMRVCRTRGRTVARSRHARVFQTESGANFRLYGCWRSNGRLLRLGGWYDCACSTADEQPTQATLYQGRFAVVQPAPSCGPTPDSCVSFPSTIADLRTRRVYRPQSSVVGLSGLVVRSSDVFAYIDARGVVAVERGSERVLDPGPGIEPESLALAGSILYWTRDGQPFSARLG